MPTSWWFPTPSVLESFLWLDSLWRELPPPLSRGHGYRSTALYPMFPENHPLVELGCLVDDQFFLDLILSFLHVIVFKIQDKVGCLP